MAYCPLPRVFDKQTQNPHCLCAAFVLKFCQIDSPIIWYHHGKNIAQHHQTHWKSARPAEPTPHWRSAPLWQSPSWQSGWGYFFIVTRWRYPDHRGAWHCRTVSPNLGLARRPSQPTSWNARYPVIAIRLSLCGATGHHWHLCSYGVGQSWNPQFVQ